MPIAGLLLSFQWVQATEEGNHFLHTIFTLPEEIGTAFGRTGQSDVQNASLYKCLELSLKNTGFLESQVKSPRERASPVTFSFAPPDSLLWSWPAGSLRRLSFVKGSLLSYN